MELPAEDTLQTGLPTHQAAVQLEYSGLLYCAVLYSTLDLDLARYYSCTTVGSRILNVAHDFGV